MNLCYIYLFVAFSKLDLKIGSWYLGSVSILDSDIKLMFCVD